MEQIIEKFNQFVKYTFSWKLLVFMFAVFIFINLYREINPILVNYLFLNIPWAITPWIILSNFSHIQLFHFFLNAYGLFLLWPLIENISWKRILIKLMLFSMIFATLWVWFLSPSAVLWFSWVLMGMLTFVFFKYKYELWMLRNQVWFFLALNIFIWFMPWISFYWHLFGAIWWYIYYYLLKKIEK